MHHANHFYGHAAVMARYAGLTGSPRIWGYLQHGWNLYDGFAVGTAFAPGYPKFVWSEACAARGWLAGRRNYVVVGAPWLYLLEVERQQHWAEAAPDRSGTIVYPFHGWEGQHIRGRHAAYLDEILEVESGREITICLYWHEYAQAEVRRQYEAAGVRVITHGHRGHMYRGTDLGFLDRQLGEIRRHERVVSNRLTSAVLYGAAAGAEVGVYGDPMELGNDHPVLGGAQRPRLLFPQMYQTHVPRDVAIDVARHELGSTALMSPAEVRYRFGWDTRGAAEDQMVRPGVQTPQM